MAAPRIQHYYTPEEYLALEREAEYKSEYINGQIVAMAGASREHSLITGNLFWLLKSQLRGRTCEIHATEMRVSVSAQDMYTYPDIVVVCGESQWEDRHGDTLLNPTVIIEVLSPSTERYDRQTRFSYYDDLVSVQEYLLVAQDRMKIQHFVREDDGWRVTMIIRPDAILELPSINCQVRVADVYADISFSPGPGATEGA